jgi:hypothetical protein
MLPHFIVLTAQPPNIPTAMFESMWLQLSI